MTVVVRWVALVVAVSAVGCSAGHAGGAKVAPAAVGGARDGGLAARSFERRPSVVLLERDGDPVSAIAVNVAVPRLVDATALLAFVEARLAKAGVARVDGQADRFGFRVRAVVTDAASASRATSEILRALSTPLDAADAPARRLAGARLAALASRPADDPALASLLQCTGQAVYAGEPLLALDKDADFVALEALRKRVVGYETVTVAVVGPPAVTSGVVDAVTKGDDWPAKGEVLASTPAGVEIAYIEPTRRRGTAKISVARASTSVSDAFAFSDADSVSAINAHLARVRGPRLVRVVTSAHQGGSCALLEAEGDVELDAAGGTAKLLRQELSRAVVADPGRVARAVRAIEDPRDAAAAASLFGAPFAPAASPPSFVVALGVAPPRTKTPDLDAVRKEAASALSVALAKVEPTTSGVEVRVRAEPGQRDAWVALGTTCPATDADSAAGVTAALVTAAAGLARDLDDVAVEPWSFSSTAGIVAHGPPRAGEPEADHARRIARVAAKALLGGPPRADAHVSARAQLFARFDDSGDRAREAVAASAGRGRVAHFLPWGTSEGLGRLDAPSLVGRWSSLANGPLRVAVIAPSNVDHAKAASDEVERFTRGTDARRCAPAPAWERPAAGSRVVAPPPGLSARAYVVAPVDARDPLAAAALVASVNDPDGAVAVGVRPRGLGARAYLLGELDTAMLVVELVGAGATLDGAVGDVSQALVAAGRTLPDALVDRAIARAVDDDLRDRSTPRRRVLDLFRDRSPAASPTRDAVAKLAQRTFASSNLSQVVALPKPP